MSLSSCETSLCYNLNMDTRVIFMGSPDFAIPALRALHEIYNVAGVVTQPDRPSGRGRLLTPPPVKVLAQELGLPIMQPRRLREPEPVAQLRAWEPDVIVVAAFGQILSRDVLDLPPHGCVNVHASLLPRWRGAAPVRAALLHGDDKTGVTIMRMDSGIDTGPILNQRSTAIREKDNAESLTDRLAVLGAELLIETLPLYLEGKIKPEPQDETAATYAPMLEKEHGLLDFATPAEALANKVRAFYPWPGAFTNWDDKILKIHKAHAVAEKSPGPGIPLEHQGMPAVGAGEGILVLDMVQPAGKKAMPGKVFLHGARGWGK